MRKPGKLHDATDRTPPGLRVLVTDPIHDDALTLLTEHGFHVEQRLGLSPSALQAIIPHYEALICRTSTKVGSDLLAAATKLKCIGLSSTGYDQIDIVAASKQGVAVIGLPAHNRTINPATSGNFVSTAEHTILLILAALGDFYNAAASMKAGRWEKSQFLGREASGKTLGIIGLGRIGLLVAERARAFGMRPIAYDPYRSGTESEQCGVPLVSFDALCAQADIITIHAPKTPETVDLINEHAFSQMQKGVILVNAGRSEIINTPALLAALDQGIVSRAALDVFKDEPHGVEWELVNHKHVIATPHIAGSTTEALRRISYETAQSVIDFLNSRDVPNIINPID